MAIAEPLRKESKSEYKVVYKDGDNLRVRSKKVKARSPGTAVAEVRKSNRSTMSGTSTIGPIKLPRAFETPDEDSNADRYKERLSRLVESRKTKKESMNSVKIEQRKFDYQGHRTVGELIGNKIGAIGSDNTESWEAREKLNRYYRDNPEKMMQRGTKDHVINMHNKLSRSAVKGKLYDRKLRGLKRATKKADPKYEYGKVTKAAAKIGVPLISVPLGFDMGATEALGTTIIAGGTAYDAIKMKHLRSKNKDLDRKYKDLEAHKKSVRSEEKYQTRVGKEMRRLAGKKTPKSLKELHNQAVSNIEHRDKRNSERKAKVNKLVSKFIKK